MKKIIFIALVLCSFLTMTSCTKDEVKEEEPSLTGKWEFSEDGVVIGGQELLVDYQHQSGCAKDFTTITATAIASTFHVNRDCAIEIDTTPYTRSGNILLSKINGETIKTEIKTLDSNTLKLYSTDSDSPQIINVTVLKRIN